MPTLCKCREAHLFRVERRWWMRLLYPSRGFYQCAACGQFMLLRKADAHQRNADASAARSALTSDAAGDPGTQRNAAGPAQREAA
jgi:hypothetical protein